MDYHNPETYLEGAVLLIDKPLKWTSFDVVNKIRKSLRHHLGIQKIKVGHTGTLDPLATGLVIICTGKATKKIMQFQDLDKAYEAKIRFGATTPSIDLETGIDEIFPFDHITEEMVINALTSFTGIQEQLPPQYSAKSVDGKRAYNMAREGKMIELKPHYITVHRIKLISFTPPDLTLQIECSKGTYIRSLARDLGIKLSSGAHLTGLRRTKIGPHNVSEAISIVNFIEKLELL